MKNLKLAGLKCLEEISCNYTLLSSKKITVRKNSLFKDYIDVELDKFEAVDKKLIIIKKRSNS